MNFLNCMSKTNGLLIFTITLSMHEKNGHMKVAFDNWCLRKTGNDKS